MWYFWKGDKTGKEGWVHIVDTVINKAKILDNILGQSFL